MPERTCKTCKFSIFRREMAVSDKSSDVLYCKEKQEVLDGNPLPKDCEVYNRSFSKVFVGKLKGE